VKAGRLAHFVAQVLRLRAFLDRINGQGTAQSVGQTGFRRQGDTSMQRRTAKIYLSASPLNFIYRRDSRVWLVVLLLAAASFPAQTVASPGGKGEQQQIFRLMGPRLAQTRAG
jgi:hypothetical protein